MNLKIWYNFFLDEMHARAAASSAGLQHCQGRGRVIVYNLGPPISRTVGTKYQGTYGTYIHNYMYRRYTVFKVFVSTAQGPCNSAICARCCLPAVAPTQHILMMAKSPRCVTPPTIAGWQSVDRIVLFDYLTTKGGQRINFRLSRPTEGQRRML